MSPLFRAGQLVSLANWMEDPVDLYDRPGISPRSTDGTLGIIGQLVPRDVALVVAVPSRDGTNVYVLGPRGGGWTLGAILHVL